jgi:hypothetical protein
MLSFYEKLNIDLGSLFVSINISIALTHFLSFPLLKYLYPYITCKKSFHASGICKSSLGERMVKYEQRVSVSNFIMYHAYKNIKITSKFMKIQLQKRHEVILIS